MMNFHEDVVNSGGLFLYTLMEMAKRKATLPLPSGVWYAAPVGWNAKHERRVRGGGHPIAPTSGPVKLIVPVTINAVEDDVELPHEDTIVELEPSKPLEHEDAELLMDAAAGEEVEQDEEQEEALQVVDAAGEDVE